MDIAGCIALVSGANRGIGAAIVRALAARGAAKIYAGARDPARIEASERIVPVRLDITRDEDVRAAARSCADVTLLVNNAGVARFEPLLDTDDLDAARLEMETNYFGTLRMCRAFAPVLAAHGGGTLVNVLSTASWLNAPMQGSYCASKAAAWSLTRGVRIELRAQGTKVIGVHPGYVDTDMTAHVRGPKARPEDIAERTLDGIERELETVLTDPRAEEVYATMRGDPDALDRAMDAAWAARTRARVQPAR